MKERKNGFSCKINAIIDGIQYVKEYINELETKLKQEIQLKKPQNKQSKQRSFKVDPIKQKQKRENIYISQKKDSITNIFKMQKTEQYIRNLFDKKIEFDELEVEINKLKPHFSQCDKQLIAQLHQKYNKSREYQSNILGIIKTASENEFTEDGINVIEELTKSAKSLNVDYPELRRLDTVKLIPKWVNRLHQIIVESFNKNSQKDAHTSQGNSESNKDMKFKKTKPFLVQKQEIIKGLDGLDPSKISSQMKQDLIDCLCKNLPQVLDQELNRILNKVKLTLWNKDAFDLLGKDSISVQDLISLRDSPIQDDNSSKSLKYKYITYHKHITDLVKQQEIWMSKALQIEEKFPTEESNLERTDFEVFKKALEILKKLLSSNIEKIIEVREKYLSIQQKFQTIEWSLDCEEYLKNDVEKKKLEDLEVLYRRGQTFNISKQLPTFSALETLYTQVKDLMMKSKKIKKSCLNSKDSKESKMEIETEKNKFEIIDYEKKSESLKNKISQEEFDSILERMKDLNSRIDFDSQIQFFENSKKNQEKYIQLVTRCYNTHMSSLDNYSQTPIEDLVSIRNQIYEISNLEQNIVVNLSKYKVYFLKLHWSIDCAFFLSVSSQIQMKRDLEECKKLVRASTIVKDIENSKLYKSLNEQLNLYSQCSNAVDVLKKNEKKKGKEREFLTSIQQFKELENQMKLIIIEDRKSLFNYIEKNKRKIEMLIEEYNGAIKNGNRLPLKFWKDLLEKFSSNKIPVKCDEECMLEVLIQDAQEMETTLIQIKSNMENESKKSQGNQQNQLSEEALELLERYRIQQVKLPEAEKLLEKQKQKEDALSSIEKKIYGSLESLTYEETIKITAEIQNLKFEFKGDRIEKLQQELFLKNILVLKQQYDNNEGTKGISIKQFNDLFEESKNKFQERTETRFQNALKFLQEVNTKCTEKVKEIENISSVKDLEALLKVDKKSGKKNLKICGFIDIINEVNGKLTQLKQEIEQQKRREHEKFQKDKQLQSQHQERIEEERVQKQVDPRLQKRREAEEKLKEKQNNENKQSSKLQSALINDLSKAISLTYSNMSLKDCLQYGGLLVDCILNDKNNTNQSAQDQVNAYCKLFSDLQSYPKLSSQVKQNKFDFKELQRILKLQSGSKYLGGDKDALEQEEKILEISNNKSDNIQDIKIKKKDSNKIEGNTLVKKQKTENLQINEQQNNKIDDLPQQKAIINEKNILKQSTAKMIEGKLSTKQKTLSLASSGKKSKKFDDYGGWKDDGEEYIPLREEDFQSLNEALTQKHKNFSKEQENQSELNNPDEEVLNQKQDEANESVPVISLLKCSLEIQFSNNEQPFPVDHVQILTCEDVKECMIMPQSMNKNQTLKTKGVMGVSNFYSYHLNLMKEKQQPERKIRMLSGWIESETIEGSKKLQSYANQLKNSKRVAVVDWSTECKIYIIHCNQWNNKRNESNLIKFKRNFFHYQSNPNDALLYIMIFKNYKLPKQNEYETILPIFMQRPSNSQNTQISLKQATSNSINTNEKISIAGQQNIISDADTNFSKGKKSLHKISQQLSQKCDEEYQTQNNQGNDILITEQIQGIKNQISLLGSKFTKELNQQSNQNYFESVKKYETPYSQLQNQPPTHNHNQNQIIQSQQKQFNNMKQINQHQQINQQQLPLQQQIYQQQVNQKQQIHSQQQLNPQLQKTQQIQTHQQQIQQQQQFQQQQQTQFQQQSQFNNASSRFNTSEKQYSKSVNRSGVSTPNYYEQFGGETQEPFSRNQISQNYNQQFTSNQQQPQINKPSYQNSQNFNQQNNYQPQPQQGFNTQQQSQSLSYANNNQQSQENFVKRQLFNGNLKGFKRTYHTTNQLPEKNIHKKINENLQQLQQQTQQNQDPQIQNILMSLDQSMKELLKQKESQASDFFLTKLLQQQQQQSQLIQELQKQNATNSQTQKEEEKKKKTSRKRTKKRSANSAGLNRSVSIDGSQFEDTDSQNSFSIQGQNSQMNSLQFRNMNIQQNIQTPGQFNSLNQKKKQFKVYTKQVTKTINQHENIPKNIINETQQFVPFNKQQPTFSKNNNQNSDNNIQVTPQTNVSNQYREQQVQNYNNQNQQMNNNKNTSNQTFSYQDNNHAQASNLNQFKELNKLNYNNQTPKQVNTQINNSISKLNNSKQILGFQQNPIGQDLSAQNNLKTNKTLDNIKFIGQKPTNYQSVNKSETQNINQERQQNFSVKNNSNNQNSIDHIKQQNIQIQQQNQLTALDQLHQMMKFNPNLNQISQNMKSVNKINNENINNNNNIINNNNNLNLNNKNKIDNNINFNKPTQSTQKINTVPVDPQRTQMPPKIQTHTTQEVKTINNAINNTQNTQEQNKILGIKDISTRIINPNQTNNAIGNRLPPSLSFRSLSKDFDKDNENIATVQQLPVRNSLQTTFTQERSIFQDLSKSGKVNQDNQNSFISLRGEIKESVNTSINNNNNNNNNSEIPRYLKEKSVRNPTFYPANKQDYKQKYQESLQLPKKNIFSYSSVSQNEESIDKQQEKNNFTEKENNYRKLY